MPTPRLRLAAIGAACVAAVTLAMPTAAAVDGGRPIHVEMTGAQEAPGPGDPDGTGSASFWINPGQERVCYSLTVANIEPVTVAHIHIAPEGVAGPIVVPLDPPTSGSSSACADVDRDLAKALIQNPEDYYVNVHNSSFPAGAVRGQLG